MRIAAARRLQCGCDTTFTSPDRGADDRTEAAAIREHRPDADTVCDRSSYDHGDVNTDANHSANIGANRHANTGANRGANPSTNRDANDLICGAKTLRDLRLERAAVQSRRFGDRPRFTPGVSAAAATVAANGNIYVVGLTARNGTMTQFIGRIDIFNASGIKTTSPINTPVFSGGAASGFTGIAVDGTGGIFVSRDTEVFSTNADGTPSTPTITGFVKSEGVALDTTGKIHVTDLGANKVVTFDSTGTPTGPTIAVGSPHDIVFNSGKLYVTSDRPVNTLTTYLANGTASTPTIPPDSSARKESQSMRRAKFTSKIAAAATSSRLRQAACRRRRRSPSEGRSGSPFETSARG